MELRVLYLGGEGREEVGTLHEREDGWIFFEYAAEWSAGNRELSPIYLPNATRVSGMVDQVRSRS